MRESFDSFFGIIYYYYYLKANVGTNPTTFPSEDKIKGMPFIPRSAVQQQSSREEKLAFIGDVDRFLFRELKWFERIIFLKRVPEDGEEETFENITVMLNIAKKQNPHFEVFPKSLNNRGYASYIFKRCVKKGWIYFKGKGYLIDPPKNRKNQEPCQFAK